MVKRKVSFFTYYSTSHPSFRYNLDDLTIEKCLFEGQGQGQRSRPKVMLQKSLDILTETIGLPVHDI